MRNILLILLGFTAVTAVVSGILMVTEPSGSLFKMDTALLKHSPFDDFLVPGLVLAVIVGGMNAVAFIVVITNKSYHVLLCILAALMTGGWILIQMIMIRTIDGLQFFYLLVAILILLITYNIRHKEIIDKVNNKINRS